MPPMLLVVGQIGRPHGIRGEVIVDVRTDEPEERFAAGSVLAPIRRRLRRRSVGVPCRTADHRVGALAPGPR